MLRQAAQSRLTVPLCGDVQQQGKPKNTEVRIVPSVADRVSMSASALVEFETVRAFSTPVRHPIYKAQGERCRDYAGQAGRE